MFEAFYGFSADPFRLTPDRAFCFDHANFSKARAYVEYALLRGEGFVVITGHPGMGKTTLIRDLQARLIATGANMRIGLIANSRLEAEDLLRMTAHAFGLEVPVGTKSSLLIQLNAFFLTQHRAGRRVLLIIDEAQDLLVSGLEELRLLTNFEQAGEPLLQILLVGQRPLHDLIRTESLDQLRQRIVAAWALEPLTPAETVGYVRHRLERAGWLGDPVFDPGVLQQVHAFSRGIPRLINLMCNRLLLRGFSLELHRLSVDDARRVIAELHEEGLAPPEHRSLGTLASTSGLTGGDGADSASDPSQDWSLIDQGLSRPRPVEEWASAKAATMPSDRPIIQGSSAPPPTAVVAEPMADSIPGAGALPAETGSPLWHRDTSDEPEGLEDRVEASGVENWPSPDAVSPRSSRIGVILFGLLSLGLAAGGGGLYGLYPETAHRLVESAHAWIENRALPVFEDWKAGLATLLGTENVPDMTTEVAADTGSLAVESEDPTSAIDVEPPLPDQTTPMTESRAPETQVEDAQRQPMESPEPMEWSDTSVAGSESVPDPVPVTTPLDADGSLDATTEMAAHTDPLAVAEPVVAAETAVSESDVASIEEDLPEAPVRESEPPFEPVTVDVLFDFNSVKIMAPFGRDLDRVIAILDQTPRTIAEIHGFSDQIGDEQYNLALSRRRAESVAAYLVKHGILRERLSVDGLGPLDPARDGVVRGMTSERASRLVRVRILRPEARAQADPGSMD